MYCDGNTKAGASFSHAGRSGEEMTSVLSLLSNFQLFMDLLLRLVISQTLQWNPTQPPPHHFHLLLRAPAQPQAPLLWEKLICWNFLSCTDLEAGLKIFLTVGKKLDLGKLDLDWNGAFLGSPQTRFFLNLPCEVHQAISPLQGSLHTHERD